VVARKHCVDPSQHELLGLRATARFDLVAHDEVPDQTKNQFHVAVENVFGAYQIHYAYIFYLRSPPKLPYDRRQSRNSGNGG